MTRWREYPDLYHIDEIKETPEEAVPTSPLPGPPPPPHPPSPPKPPPPLMMSQQPQQSHSNSSSLLFWIFYNKGRPVYESATLRPPRQLKPELEAESNLIRCMSDASLVKRRRGGRGKSQAQRERERQHRFSINGHFYNYKAGPTLPHPQAEATPPSTLCPTLLSPLCSSLPPADVHLHAVLRRLHQGSHFQPDDDGPGDRAAAHQVQGELLRANRNVRSTPGRAEPLAVEGGGQSLRFPKKKKEKDADL